MLEKPQRGLLENLNIVANVNCYSTVLENFKSYGNQKGVNRAKDNSKFLLCDFKYRSICETLRSMNCDMITTTKLFEKQSTCQSREPPTESNSKIFGSECKHVLNRDPQEEYLLEGILKTKSGDNLPTAINTSTETPSHQSFIGQKRGNIKEKELTKGRDQKRGKEDGVLFGAERKRSIHQGNNRDSKNRDMAEENGHNTGGTGTDNDCNLQDDRSSHVREVRHHGIKSNKPRNLAGHKCNPCLQDQQSRTPKERANKNGCGKGRDGNERRRKRRGTDYGQKKGRNKRLNHRATDGKRMNELVEEQKLLEFYLKILWGLIMKLLSKILKKRGILFKKPMWKLKNLRRIKKANLQLFTDEFG